MVNYKEGATTKMPALHVGGGTIKMEAMGKKADMHFKLATSGEDGLEIIDETRLKTALRELLPHILDWQGEATDIGYWGALETFYNSQLVGIKSATELEQAQYEAIETKLEELIGTRLANLAYKRRKVVDLHNRCRSYSTNISIKKSVQMIRLVGAIEKATMGFINMGSGLEGKTMRAIPEGDESAPGIGGSDVDAAQKAVKRRGKKVVTMGPGIDLTAMAAVEAGNESAWGPKWLADLTPKQRKKAWAAAIAATAAVVSLVFFVDKCGAMESSRISGVDDLKSSEVGGLVIGD